MKKLLFICIVCLCASIQSHAQMRDTTINMSTHKVDANALFQKAKNQKTAAWIMLGGGAGLAIAGYIIMENDFIRDPWGYGNHPTGAVIFVTGDALMLGSIPFFIASGKNGRKANLMLKNENVFFNPQLNLNHFVALGIKLNL